MKALSVHPEWAYLIACGEKTIECRTWKTNHRGPLLICATAKKVKGLISGHALCVVDLIDIHPFTEADLEAACMDEMPEEPCYAWVLNDPGAIIPIPVKGQLGLWNYPAEEEELAVPSSDEEYDEIFNRLTCSSETYCS